jgi:hypothetical protein
VLAPRKIALVSAAALCLAATAAVPAFASDPDVPPCDAATAQDLSCVVSLKDGAHVRLKVPDVLCVRVDALSQRTTANVHARIPCPPHQPVPVVPVPVAPVEIPSDNGTGEAPTPVTVPAHLPVTG